RCGSASRAPGAGGRRSGARAAGEPIGRGEPPRVLGVRGRSSLLPSAAPAAWGLPSAAPAAWGLRSDTRADTVRVARGGPDALDDAQPCAPCTRVGGDLLPSRPERSRGEHADGRGPAAGADR